MSQKYKKVDKYLLIINSPIGEGSFGKVYKARLAENNQLFFAVKVIQKKTINKDQYLLQALFNQISIMKRLKSEYIVSLQEVLETNNNYYIIQQFCDSGDLRAFIKNNKEGVEQAKALKIIGDILEGFIQLIKYGIIHRDLKPQNILIHKQAFKIADFGFAKNLVNFRNQMLSSYVGTPLYMSPQMLKQQQHTSKSDIWSLGLILYQLLHGKTPWKAKSEWQLVQKIQHNELTFANNINPKIQQLIRGCLQKNEKQRLSFDQIFNDPIFGNRFSKFLQKAKLLQDKAIYIINHLRMNIHSKNINMLQLFKQYDYSKDAKLNKRQFYKLLLSIDRKIKKEEVYYIFNKFDNDGNGQIEFQEFKMWLQKNDIKMEHNHNPNYQMNPEELKAHQAIQKLKAAIDQTKQDLKTIFNIFDKDNSDQLDFEQFSRLLKLIVPTLSKQQIQLAFQKFDINGDKLITFQQFTSLLQKMTGKAPIYDKQFQQRLKYIDIQLKQMEEQMMKK